MRISAIVPAYNCSGTLAAVVESIYLSGLDVFEIVIVNDGSTDDTESVLQKLSARFPDLRVINQENHGVSAARNNGIHEAKGEYVFFIDADDSLEQGSLLEANEILEAERPDMLFFGMRFDYYYKDKLYRSDVLSETESGIMDKKTACSKFEELFQNNMLSPVWNKLIRRELIVSNRISFREDMIEMEDYLFSVSCLSRCSDIYVHNKAAYRYRQPENERGTYNRLWRIPRLSRYIEPFYDIARRFSVDCCEPQKVLRVADRIYSNLFHEQIRFASPKQIRTAAGDMLSCEHSGAVAALDSALYKKLKDKQYFRVWIECKMKQLRHAAAVRIKYLRSLRGSM